MAIEANQTALASDLFHARILDTLAGQDLLAGDRVGQALADSTQVSKAMMYNTSGINQAPTLGSTPSGGAMQFCPIDDDKIFVMYESTSTTLIGVVAVVNRDDMSISFGAELTITNDSRQIEGCSADIIKIDTNKVAIAYVSNATQYLAKSIICTISGTTITVGSSQTIDTVTSGTLAYITLVKLDTNKFACYYSKGTVYRIIAGTVSGTVVTYGSAVATGTSMNSRMHITQIDTNKFLMFSDNNYIQIGTVSSKVITLGSQQNTSMSGSGDLYGDLQTLTTDKVIISTTTHVIVATISGTVATFGSQLAMSDGTSGTMRVLSPTEVHAYRNGGQAILKFTISGTVITQTKMFATRWSFNNSQESSRHGTINMPNGYWIMMINTGGVIRYFIEGQSINFIGIVVADALRGEAVQVVVSGIAGGLSGLTPGETYAVGWGGVLDFSLIANIDNPNEEHLLRAISDTQVVL